MGGVDSRLVVVHVLSLLASKCIGMCTYYVQPLRAWTYLDMCTYQPLNSLYFLQVADNYTIKAMIKEPVTQAV